jgi:hypothetical protein
MGMQVQKFTYCCAGAIIPAGTTATKTKDELATKEHKEHIDKNLYGFSLCSFALLRPTFCQKNRRGFSAKKACGTRASKIPPILAQTKATKAGSSGIRVMQSKENQFPTPIAFTFWTVWLGVWLDFLDDRYGAASGAFFIAFCRKNSAKRSSRGETKRPRPFISDNCVSAFCHQSPELPSPFFSKASAIFQ